MKEEKNKNNSTVIIALVFTIIMFGIGFFIGKNTAGTAGMNRNTGQFNGTRNGQPTGGIQRNRAVFKPINGEIINADDKSVTVKLPDGSSKIVLLSDKTQINKAETATIKDLIAGQKVMVIGQDNPDGSVSATNIQLNPIARQIKTDNPR